jgi:hypothetical protein
MTTQDATFVITNRNDGSGGGVMNGNVTLDLSAANISSGGDLVTDISANRGGHISGNAFNHVSAAGDLTAQGALDFEIENAGFLLNNVFVPGGTIDMDATINVSATNISATTDYFQALISNAGGGHIGGNAVLDISASNGLTSGGDAFFSIINSPNGQDTPAGTIGGNATIQANVGSMSVDGLLNAVIDNTHGSIGGNAIVNFILSGAIDTQGDADFQIFNATDGSSAGTIGLDATINVTAANISTGGAFDAAIDNSSGGAIGGSANIVFNLAGDLTTQGDAILVISNFAGGTIGSDTAVTLSANSISSSGAFSATIDNTGGSIGGNAAINVTAANITANSLLAEINNSNGGSIGSGANVTLNVGGDLTTQGDAAFQILNFDDGSGSGPETIGSNATVNVTANNVSTGGSLNAAIDNSSGGTIGGMATLSFDLSGDLTTTSGDASFRIDNANRSGISGGSINGDAIINIGVGGDISAQGTGLFEISNDDAGTGNGGGTIGSNATISVGADNISTGGPLFARIINSGGGNIVGGANLNFSLTGSLTTQSGGAAFQILNFDNGFGSGPGTIGGNATVNVTANNISTGGALFATIENFGGGTIGGNATINLTAANITANSLVADVNNSNGGSIGSGANVTLDVGGNLTTQGDANFQIATAPGTIGSNATVNVTANNISTGGTLSASIMGFGGTIGGDAAVNVSAASISTAGSFFASMLHGGGHIVGSADLSLNLTGDLTTVDDAIILISNIGGTIDSHAMVNVTANNVLTGTLNAAIDNSSGGTIGGIANLFFDLSGDLTTTSGDASFVISNFNGGNIGADAAMNLSAASISTGGALFADIYNYQGGNIVGGADLSLNLTGDLTTVDDATFLILNNPAGTIGSDAVINVTANNISTGGTLSARIENSNAGAIGGNATINVTAANITANSLLAQIANTGGSIGGNAAINMNVSGSATVTNDATVAISGNDPAGSAEINIDGSYDVGGTFLSRIDGNGTITFDNASAHADVLKAGVFGTNGVLNVGGGGLSADTTLKLYAPGSNGQLNFVSNVTLGGNSLKILAANSVTIFNNIVVTIGGPNPADVFVNFVGGVPNANYTGFGGNNSTSGTFAGAGANNPQPLINAPPFGPSSPAPIPNRTRIHPRPPVTTGVINVSSSDELLALLDDFTPGRRGRIRIPDSNRGSHGRNASRSNTAAYLNAARRAMDRQTASTPAMRRLPQ